MRIKYLVVSDVHLGHTRTKTDHILKSLDEFFGYFSKHKDLDILFIAGDLFDGLLDNHTSEYHDIVLWIHRLINYCGTNSIKLRVLEGTPSHDWGQCRIFETLREVSNADVDLKYIDTISIEHIESLGIDVLYVPDEATESPIQTYNYVTELLTNRGISKVDIAIMHGFFNYQLSQIKTSQGHIETDYLSITRYYIHIGHVHTHSVYKRIIAEGSFDRLAHGEEEAKGVILAEIDTSTEQMTYTFLENTNACIHRTIVVRRCNSLEQAIARLDKEICKLPVNSYVRIQADKSSVIYQSIDELKRRYADYNLSKKAIGEEDVTMTTDSLLEALDYPVITITVDNIADLINSEIQTDKLDRHKLNVHLNQIINAIA